MQFVSPRVDKSDRTILLYLTDSLCRPTPWVVRGGCAQSLCAGVVRRPCAQALCAQGCAELCAELCAALCAGLVRTVVRSCARAFKLLCTEKWCAGVVRTLSWHLPPCTTVKTCARRTAQVSGNLCTTFFRAAQGFRVVRIFFNIFIFLCNIVSRNRLFTE